MVDLSGFKILRLNYPFSSDELGVMIWDKMNDQEKKWALKLTLNGINDTGDDGGTSWDLFFLDERLKSKIEDLLKKYDVPYDVEDLTHLLVKGNDEFTEEFNKKLNFFLSENLSIDDVLDNIIEVGYENMTIFEKYYLDTNPEILEGND
jgi:hypothetical protein